MRPSVSSSKISLMKRAGSLGGKNLASLGQVLLQPLLEELHEPHRLVEVSARTNTSQAPDLVREMEGVVRTCSAKLVDELAEQLKAISWRRLLAETRSRGRQASGA